MPLFWDPVFKAGVSTKFRLTPQTAVPRTRQRLGRTLITTAKHAVPVPLCQEQQLMSFIKKIVILLLIASPALAQQTNIRWDSIATNTNGQGTEVPLLAMPNAAVTFYNACTAPCSPTIATTYTAAVSSTACPSGAGVVWQLPLNQA